MLMLCLVVPQLETEFAGEVECFPRVPTRKSYLVSSPSPFLARRSRYPWLSSCQSLGFCGGTCICGLRHRGAWVYITAIVPHTIIAGVPLKKTELLIEP